MKRETFSIETFSGGETKKIAEELARKILKNTKLPIVIALSGDLGAGKTTFIKGLAKGLGIKKNVVSPTFMLIQKYNPQTRKPANPQTVFYHIDPYRLENIDAIIPDIKELLNEKNAIIAIEWAGLVKEILPNNTIWIELEHKEKNRRRIVIKFAS